MRQQATPDQEPFPESTTSQRHSYPSQYPVKVPVYSITPTIHCIPKHKIKGPLGINNIPAASIPFTIPWYIVLHPLYSVYQMTGIFLFSIVNANVLRFVSFCCVSPSVLLKHAWRAVVTAIVSLVTGPLCVLGVGGGSWVVVCTQGGSTVAIRDSFSSIYIVHVAALLWFKDWYRYPIPNRYILHANVAVCTQGGLLLSQIAFFNLHRSCLMVQRLVPISHTQSLYSMLMSQYVRKEDCCYHR